MSSLNASRPALAATRLLCDQVRFAKLTPNRVDDRANEVHEPDEPVVIDPVRFPILSRHWPGLEPDGGEARS